LNYVKTNYVGANFVVAAAGNVNADAFLKAAETAFSTVPQKDVSLFVPNTEKPYFTPSYVNLVVSRSIILSIFCVKIDDYER